MSDAIEATTVSPTASAVTDAFNVLNTALKNDAFAGDTAHMLRVATFMRATEDMSNKFNSGESFGPAPKVVSPGGTPGRKPGRKSNAEKAAEAAAAASAAAEAGNIDSVSSQDVAEGGAETPVEASEGVEVQAEGDSNNGRGRGRRG